MNLQIQKKKNFINENLEILKREYIDFEYVELNPKNLKKVTKYFSKDYKPYVIGKISKGNNKVKLNGTINWS